MAKAKEACPECGKKLLHVSTHLKNVHGIAGGVSGKTRARKQSVNGLRVEKGFVILTDDAGHMWIAEQIR